MIFSAAGNDHLPRSDGSENDKNECTVKSMKRQSVMKRKTGWRAIVCTLTITFQSFGFEFFMVTSFDRAFPDKWLHSPSGVVPSLSYRDTVYAGMPLAIHFFFKKYSRNDSNKVDLSFSYKIVKPNGKLFCDTTGIVAHTGLIAKDAGLLLSRSIPMVLFSRKETPGKYKIIVTAEDKTDKTKKTLEKAIILSKYPKIGPHYFDDITLNRWVHGYCIAPDPGRAVAAFSYFIESKLSNDDNVFWPVFYFFQCLFIDNPSLIEELAGNFSKSSSRLQEYTVFLLRAIQFDKRNSGYPIPDSLWKKFDKAAETGFYDPFATAFKIKSNTLMEFGFYYYGHYAMIRFLIDCLGLNSASGYEAFLKSCNDYGVDCVKSLDNETAQQFYSDAKKILKKSYPKHQLVNAYCNFAYEKNDLEINAKKTLEDIIASLKESTTTAKGRGMKDRP
jgi:hypothetical protein